MMRMNRFLVDHYKHFVWFNVTIKFLNGPETERFYLIGPISAPIDVGT